MVLVRPIVQNVAAPMVAKGLDDSLDDVLVSLLAEVRDAFDNRRAHLLAFAARPRASAAMMAA